MTTISERGDMNDLVLGKRICMAATAGSDSMLRGARLQCPWVRRDGGLDIYTGEEGLGEQIGQRDG
jgi:hypothetical protein